MSVWHSRRAVLGAAAALGAGAAVAACGSTADKVGKIPQANTNGTGTEVAQAADVPVGGGVILREFGAVVTQPEAGQFRAFDIHCTHTGCPLGSITDGVIQCPCHGSRFSVADGSVLQGPAVRPLVTLSIVDQGGRLLLHG